MIQNVEATTAIDMLRHWAVAEIISDRWPEYFRMIPSELIAKVRSRQLDSLVETEWHVLTEVIIAVRSPLLKDLPELRLDWYRADLAIDQLRDVRIVAFAPLVAEAPSRLLGDLPSTQAGERGLQGAPFELSRMTGRPIFVAPSLWGPYCLVEGYTRCTTMLANYRAGTLSAATFPMILGVGERVATWRWWR
jgi:hypothetical protein